MTNVAVPQLQYCGEEDTRKEVFDAPNKFSEAAFVGLASPAYF